MTSGHRGLAYRSLLPEQVPPNRVPDQKPELPMNVKDLGNRVVLITSAGSGIGRQLALPCARPASAAAGERGDGHA